MVFGIDFKYFDWQNTFAPNDSYVHISNTELTEEEIEAEKQNIGTVKKVGLTDDAYQEHYRLLTVQVYFPGRPGRLVSVIFKGNVVSYVAKTSKSESQLGW